MRPPFSTAAPGLPPERLGIAEVLVIICALLVMLAALLFELNAVRDETAKDFQRRQRLADIYLRSRQQSLDALAGRFRELYAAGAHGGELRVTVDPDRKAWRLAPGARTAIRGAAGGASPFTAAAQRELAAVVALESMALPVLAYDKDVAQLSFVSANRFQYVLTAQTPAAASFSPALQDSSAWLRALPAANPGGAMVAGQLGDDAARARPLALAAPVSVRRQWLGLIALELRPDVLQLLVARQGTAGAVALVDREGHVVARDRADRGVGTWPLPRAGKPRLRDEDGIEWRMAPLADGNLYLLHRLDLAALLRAAALRSVPAGLCVVLLAVLALVSLRLRQAMAALALQSHRDPLTHALSRRGLYEGADSLRALASRSHKPLAVVMFDIDAFRKVNEMHGHERGDKVLLALVHGLQHQVRDYDVLCRWSGEEFVAVLMLETGADAIPVAERLRNVAATACLREALTLVTISAGMAMWEPGESLDLAIGRAEQSLMAAKAGGRDRLDVSDEVVAVAG